MWTTVSGRGVVRRLTSHVRQVPEALGTVDPFMGFKNLKVFVSFQLQLNLAKFSSVAGSIDVAAETSYSAQVCLRCHPHD